MIYNKYDLGLLHGLFSQAASRPHIEPNSGLALGSEFFIPLMRHGALQQYGGTALRSIAGLVQGYAL
jgi:hypothetical protein